jgi:hypothetical protein
VAQAGTFRVKNYRETMRALARTDKDSRRAVRNEFREVGDIVKDEWVLRFREISEKSAAGLRTRVRQTGVSVEQTIGRTTGNRPDFGRLQMRYGAEALEEKSDEVVEGFGDALDHVCDRFDN